MTATTLEPQEIEKFTAIAAEWWDESGKFAPLHKINPIRVRYVRDTIYQHFDCETLKGKSLIDIGCGGGLVSEPMARLGAKVTGIDGGEKNVKTAIAHAQAMQLKIDYRTTTAEALAEKGAQFDVVLALEIIEHVSDVALFLESVAKLVKPGGVLIMSTLNRTMKSYALAIVGAEYVLRWLPRGTHDWKKFLMPAELIQPLQAHGLKHTASKGMVMNPLKWEWQMSDSDLEVNYYVCFTKM
ncbi:MAG: bifunctional 2-polyprenyl-6-hydroxyphenol methylase/3-demethylubiquinol 3-O-methyltransferase UbiG [Rickettsiales bacterium]|nr:bifunctional 2-polyprenyl-6-hydroxyphenol methylase/3-demethylubiquinol 3-O-methyltransferase UbiG [Rickettsiales bacterium]